MIIQSVASVSSSEITSEAAFEACCATAAAQSVSRSKQVEGSEPTPYGDITSYNNHYEFGPGKDNPARRFCNKRKGVL
jgi:DMSO/TMAO reductase YedYZ molybdopterin-dependent catalytic subunit